MQVGDKVFVLRSRQDFKEIKEAMNKFIEQGRLPEIGLITNIYQSEDRSYHGSPYYETIYVLQLESGATVTTDSERTNKVAILGFEDFKQKLIEYWNETNKKIAELQNRNNKLAIKLSKLNIIS